MHCWMWQFYFCYIKEPVNNIFAALNVIYIFCAALKMTICLHWILQFMFVNTFNCYNVYGLMCCNVNLFFVELNETI